MGNNTCFKPVVNSPDQHYRDQQGRESKNSTDAQKANQQRQNQLKQDSKLFKKQQQLSKEQETLKMRMDQHKEQITKREKKQKELTAQLQNKQNLIKELQQEIAGLKRQAEIKTAEINSTNQTRILPVQTVSKNELELDRRINQQNQLLAKEMRQRDQIFAERNKLDQQIQNLQNLIRQAQQKIQRLKFDHQQTLNQIEAIKQKIQKFQLELSSTKQGKRIKDKQIENIKRETYELQEETKTLNSQAQNMAQTATQNIKRYLQFFTGEILEGEEFDKEYLTEVIQSRLQSRILSTKLIYRYDTLNKVNFHKYIDGKENLVVLVKLTNEYTLGAWTQGAFMPRKISDKDGLIFSLTNKKCFQPLERNRRVIAYDDFFLIFGNSELRLKAQDNKVFSNFAINNGYFNPRGEKVNILLGSGGVREVQMQKLEIFQLVLQ